jgi:hypothetical protein
VRERVARAVVLGGMRAAPGRALDRATLDDARRVDAQEALGRGARDRDLGQLEIGGERRGIAPAQRAVELPRITLRTRGRCDR